MDMSKYREMFLTETREHLNNMSRLLVELEKNPADREGIDTLFREAHSVKGMAASMGYERTANLAHLLEDLMDGFRKKGVVPPEVVDRVLEGVDLLEGLLEDLSAERPERDVSGFLGRSTQPEANLPGTPPEEAGTSEEIRRIVIDLDPGAGAPAARALLIYRELAALGEVVDCTPSIDELAAGKAAHRLAAELLSARPDDELIKPLSAIADVVRVELENPTETEEPVLPRPQRRDEGHRSVRVQTELLDRFINLTGELITNRYALQTASRQKQWPEIQEGLGQLSRLITDLHHHVLQVRMMPLESITGRLPRLVRDLGRKSDKQIRLEIDGEDVELDRAILEQLSDPLVHMVRNAVDHGIVRSGSITVSARREKDLVLLEVADDGQGMDTEAIRQRAVAKGLVPQAKARSMRDRDVLQLVCLPGFSTADQVTETSGRGVGMDVVKSAIENLGGTLEIDSGPGRGTRITLKLPLSVAIIQILLVECDCRRLAIPITRVLRTLEVSRSTIRSSGRQMVISLGDEVVPLLSLRKMLHLPGRVSRDAVSVVIIELRGRRIGLVVDRFLGQREAFVKPLAFPLDRLHGIAGATVLGDGSIVFIVDPQPLLEEERSVRTAFRSKGEPPCPSPD